MRKHNVTKVTLIRDNSHEYEVLYYNSGTE